MNIKITFLLLISVIDMNISIATEVLEENKQFSTNLYKIMLKTDGNFISSPLSANIILSMAYQGSEGRTYDAFTKVLGVPDARAAAEECYSTLSKLNDIRYVRINIVNKLITMKYFTLKPKFRDIIVDKYYSEVDEMDFADSDKSANKINRWVEKKTENKIRQIVKSSDLDIDTRVILLNAVYFKGTWEKQFLPEDTTRETFFLLNNKQVVVEMMHLRGKINYAENTKLNVQIIELPYVGRGFSMYVILPKQQNGINDVETDIEKIDLTMQDEELSEFYVDVKLPKFKIESDLSMENILSKMGLGEIFTDDANFNKMSNDPLKISSIIQKALIEVDERGSEATVATFGGAETKSIVPTANFNAKHPFLFTIVDKFSHTILFFGRVINPNQ